LRRSTRLLVGETPLIQGFADNHPAYTEWFERYQVLEIGQLRHPT
jgi:hypothetical protein